MVRIHLRPRFPLPVATMTKPMRSTSTTAASVISKPKPVYMPRLPVPELRKTLDKYLASLEPFLREDEKRGGMNYHSGLSLRKKWADEFEQGIGKVLQDRLVGTYSSKLCYIPACLQNVFQRLTEPPQTTGWMTISGSTRRTSNGERLSSSIPTGG